MIPCIHMHYLRMPPCVPYSMRDYQGAISQDYWDLSRIFINVSVMMISSLVSRPLEESPRVSVFQEDHVPLQLAASLTMGGGCHCHGIVMIDRVPVLVVDDKMAIHTCRHGKGNIRPALLES